MSDLDVIIVGASIAGSTAAALLGRQGLKVALVEKSPDPAHFKQLCTHELVALSNPVLDRLGVLDRLREVGGPHRSPQIWTKYGWIKPEPKDPSGSLDEGLNVRREVMDPMLREVAASEPGVELHLGALVTGIVSDANGRPAGVQLREGGEDRELRARAVVGADGQHSTVAKFAGVPARLKPHERFGYAAYYEGIPTPVDDAGAPTSKFWMLDPDIAYTFPTDGGLTMLAVAPLKTPERVAAFKADPEGEFFRAYEGLSDAPDLSRARRVGKLRALVGTRNSRRPAAAPGLAFVGDAAQVTDFVWGTGCGFALASAAWLADAVGPALAAGVPDAAVDKALRGYARHHRRSLATHYLMTSDYSTGRSFSFVERTLFSAATRDQTVARAIHVMGARTKTPQRILTPALMARAVVASKTAA